MKIKNLNRKTVDQKLGTHFGVKIATGMNKSVKEIDSENRTVKFIANTYFFIDSDVDMLIPGCAKKSISDRGPQSNATAKIKHQSDHVLNTKNVVGRLTVLDERKIDNLEVMYCESHIPTTTKGNDDLINYQEDIYDNHSIGFRYRNLILAEKDSENELSRAAWEEYYPLAINPEKADEFGFFWVVKEIELFEISVVSFGANELTANLTGKSKDKNENIVNDILKRIDNLNDQLKSNVDTKSDRTQINLECLQLKQIITELKLEKPSKKSTNEINLPDNNDTLDDDGSKKSLLKVLSKTK